MSWLYNRHCVQSSAICGITLCTCKHVWSYVYNYQSLLHASSSDPALQSITATIIPGVACS